MICLHRKAHFWIDKILTTRLARSFFCVHATSVYAPDACWMSELGLVVEGVEGYVNRIFPADRISLPTRGDGVTFFISILVIGGVAADTVGSGGGCDSWATASLT